MSDKKQNNGFKILSIILLLAIIPLVIYFFSNQKKLEETNTFLKEEKKDLESKLQDMIVNYDTAIAENQTIADALEEEKLELIALRDSIKNMQVANYSIIRKYKAQLKKLEKRNANLAFRVDSLSNLAVNLTLEKQKALDSIQKTVSKNEVLQEEKALLEEKVAKGQEVFIKSLIVHSMRKKANGTYKETNKARRTSAFRVQTTLQENTIAKQEEKQVYIQIKDSNNKTISPKGKVTLANGQIISYSDTSSVDYMAKDVDLLSFIEIGNEKLEKGTYIAVVILDGKIKETKQIQLQ